MKVFNRKDTREKRKILRRNQTDAEEMLWSRLRNRQIHDLKFFRQYGINSYIADFYCPKLKLVVEIDGGHHFTNEGKEYDSVREQLFASINIRTMRFTNAEVLEHLDLVLEKIEKISSST